MDRIVISVDELNAVIKEAVETAFAAREKEEREMLVSRTAVAKRLHVDVSTLWRWHRANYLVGRKIGRSVWYLESDIRRLETGYREA